MNRFFLCLLLLLPSTIGVTAKNIGIMASFYVDAGSAPQDTIIRLDEASIVARMIKRDASKETFFITDSLRKGTVNAIQLISRISGVSTDWGTDAVNIGKDKDVPIIVNGKEVSKDYAININPQSIRKIEILRHPTGKYSDYPIVMNLVLNNYIGSAASEFSRAMYSFRNKNSNNESVGANVTYSFPKLNVYSSLSLMRKQIYNALSYEYNNESGISIKTDKVDYRHPNIRTWNIGGESTIGADYKFSDNQILSFQGWIDCKEVRKEDAFNVWQNNTSQREASKDNYNTTDYTVGLFYNGNFADRLQLSSELAFNGYNLYDDRIFVEENLETVNRYKGNKNYWRFYLSADYSLCDNLSFTVDYTQIWKDYSNISRDNCLTLYENKETRSKTMVALSYEPLDNLNFKLGSHILTVKDNDRLSNDATSQTSWMPLFKGYCKPFSWMDFLMDYYCDVEYPNLDQLSTVEWKVNDVLWHKGNPDLKPRIMHYCEFTVNILDALKFSYLLKHSNDEIIDYYIKDGANIYQTQSNCNFTHNYLGLEGDYKLWKNVRFSFVANYQWYFRYLDSIKRHGRTWYLDANIQWKIPKSKWDVMAEYFLRHDKEPLLQGRQYNEEEDLVMAVSHPLFKGKMSIALTVKLPTELISKQTYTDIDIKNFHYLTFGDNRVNSFCTLLNIKYNINNGKTSRNKNNKNIDVEK